MEKFRKFGDAATGVNPFTFVISPTKMGRVGAALMYPMRLLFCALFSLLIVVLDLLSYLLYGVYLGLLGKWFIGPLQRLVLRALLFFHGHLIPTRVSTDSSSAVVRGGKSASTTSTLRAIKAGDLVVCNMQSVWDVTVLEVTLATGYHAVAFPFRCAPRTPSGKATSGEKGEDDAEEGLVRVSAGAQKRQGDTTTDDPVAYEDGDVAIKVFWPGPLQRWRVWAYVRRTGRTAFLQSQVRASQSTSGAPAGVNAIAAQHLARARGVPILYFAEGSCTNGKGLLTMPAMRALAAQGAEGGDKECVLWTATTAYDTPALQNVVSEGEGLFAYLFRAGVLLYGSTNANWSSPFFPRAQVLARPVAVPTAQGARCLRRLPDQQAGGSGKASCVGGPWPWELSVSGVDCVRSGMVQRPKSAVVSASGGAGTGASSRRYALSVGMAEKLGFVETYTAM